jgi:hypothetical protein
MIFSERHGRWFVDDTDCALVMQPRKTDERPVMPAADDRAPSVATRARDQLRRDDLARTGSHHHRLASRL